MLPKLQPQENIIRFRGPETVSLAWRRRAELFGDGNMCGFCGQDVKSNVFEGCFSPGPSFG